MPGLFVSGRQAAMEAILRPVQVKIEPSLRRRDMATRSLGRSPLRIAAGIATVAVLLATLLITRSYHVLNQTGDESVHIACGMEWLSHHTYYYETLHPPLARAATAFLPYLTGAHYLGKPDTNLEGNALLNLHGRYWHNLTLSRLGILPFFWFACCLVFVYTARHFTAATAVIATVLFAFCPTVLAHSGLATTDAPLMAMYTWSIFALWSFLRAPTPGRALWLALAFALATLTKFTELPFFLLAAVFLIAYIVLRERRWPVPLRSALLIACAMALIIWATYLFSFAPIFNSATMTPTAAAKLQTISPRARHILTTVPVPADEFFRGLIMAKGTSVAGRAAYLLGQTYVGGRWDFFPVGFFTKTPIAFLLLFCFGFGSFLFRASVRRNRDVFLLIAAFAAPMAVGMASNMNIGLRHVLPIYPFAAIIAALGCMRLWEIGGSRRMAALRVVPVLLLGWSVTECVASTPRFLSYFNEAAAPHEYHILVAGDLDWGQDLYLLERTLHQEHASHVTLIYFGDPDIDKSGMPQPYTESLDGRRSGWIAISEAFYEGEPAKYDWLSRDPYQRVGKTIRLYHIAPGDEGP